MADNRDMREATPDADFEAQVAHWEQRIAEAGDRIEAEAPSAEVWARISARVDHLEASRPHLTVSAETGVWECLWPGVFKKRLHIEADAGWESYLLKVEPGGAIAPHAHSVLEECMVLEGEFEIDGTVVRKGDLHLAFAGRDHGVLTSAKGALLYLRGALAD